MLSEITSLTEAVLAFAGWASLDPNARRRQVGIVVRHAEEADVDLAAVELEWRLVATGLGGGARRRR